MQEILTRKIRQSPLCDILKRDVEFAFDDVHRQAFDKAKRILTSPAVITYYRHGAPFELFSDASTLHGLGFVLN